MVYLKRENCKNLRINLELKNKKKIYFCEIFGPSSILLRKLPYVYGLLRSYAEERFPEFADSYEWQNPISEFTNTDEIVGRFVDPSVAAFSCYVWNTKKNIAIAQRVKEKYPDCLIVFGGPNVSRSDMGFFKTHPYVDINVELEGEIPFSEVLKENLKDNPNWHSIPGLSVNVDGMRMSTRKGENLGKDIETPSPYLLGYYDEMIEEILEQGEGIGALWETNRGCPYSCSYCDWGSATMSRLRRFSNDKLNQELDWFSKNKISQIINCDANYGILERDLDMVHRVIDLKEQNGFPITFYMFTAKNSNDRVFEIGRLLEKSDMNTAVTLSMQSMNEPTLTAIKRGNIKLDNYKILMSRYNTEGIATLCELIVGMPMETRESHVDGIDQLLRLGRHSNLRFFPLILLPNAPLITQVDEFKIKTIPKRLFPFYEDIHSWDLSESIDLVIEHTTMTTADWIYMFLFSSTVQAFHSGGITRFFATYLFNEKNITYKDFYTKFIEYFLDDNTSIVSKMVHKINDLYFEMSTDPDKSWSAIERGEFEYGGQRADPRRKIADICWLDIMLSEEDFINEIVEFLQNELGIQIDSKMKDLISFQNDILLRIEYDPQQGNTNTYQYNWLDYFFNGEELQKKQNTVTYQDSSMGYGQETIAKGMLWSYIKSSVGQSVRGHHYIHQIKNATITYD